ncbi:MAG: caspase family protein [Euryarchaeota archaeon]|nr:caspase family protein [Euryarchaeota archaeon]
MKNDFNLIKKKFSEFEKKIETLKRLEKELSSIYSRGFESDVESLKIQLKSPDKIFEIGKGIEELKRKIDEKSVEPADEVVSETAYGVVIGIAKYEDDDIPALKYAKEDALEIYNILTDPNYGNFPKENVMLLLDEQATLTEIKSAMGTFLARAAGKEDMVCIYFAGHGSPEIDPTGKADDNLEKFIVPYDAKKDDLFSSGLSMDAVSKILDERIESKRAVFFIDSCYSGKAGGRTFSRPDVVARNITVSETFLDQLSGEGRVIITASKPEELSFETDELKHGIFTYYLAEGLKGKADTNKDGFVTVDELYSYVSKQVTREARLLGVGQHPVKKGMVVGEISLTRCETKEMALANGLNSEAHKLFKEGKYGDAREMWNEVLKIDSTNTEALAGIEESKKMIEEMEAIIREKQRRLLDLHNTGLPAKEYDEAMILLKKNPKTYTELELDIVEYIEKLLKEDISIDVYIDTLKLVKENYKQNK